MQGHVLAPTSPHALLEPTEPKRRRTRSWSTNQRSPLSNSQIRCDPNTVWYGLNPEGGAVRAYPRFADGFGEDVTSPIRPR